MSVLSCLALIVAMESRGEALQTQHYVASVAIERAKEESVGICQSMKRPRAYSWMWDKVKTKVDKKSMLVSESVAAQELKHQSLRGRLYFNERKLRKRYNTPHKPIVSGNLIFY